MIHRTGYPIGCLFIAIAIVLLVSPALAQHQHKSDHQPIQSIKNSAIDSSLVITDLPPEYQQTIEYLDFKNTDIKDVLRGLASKYNLNILVDNDIGKRITIHLSNVTAYHAMKFIVEEHGFVLHRDGNIFKVSAPVLPEPEPPPPPKVVFENGLLSLDFHDEDLHRAMYEISRQSGMNIVINRGVNGLVSGFLQKIAFEKGIKTLMDANGYVLRKRDGVYIVEDRISLQEPDNPTDGRRRSRTAWVEVKDSLISLDVTGGDMEKIIRDIADRMGIDIIFYGEIKGHISAKYRDLPLEQALTYIFRGTDYTFRQDGKVYLIGNRKVQGITRSKLIRLKHIKAEGIIELLPASITSQAALKIIKEHNGLMVIGSHDVIQEAQEFVDQIDFPIPQILIEALVVDYNTTDISEFSLEAGTRPPEDTSRMNFSFFPDIKVDARSDYLNKQLSILSPHLGLSQVGKLPRNFYVKLEAMEQDGKANIRSRPQIATLNGHTASISIGTTQYFILKSNTPYTNYTQQQPYVTETERFEKITAQMELKITPWVSASGEITVEIHPEFSTPKGSLNSSTPPTIDHRILDSTVRLKDGETIILGGLRQTTDNSTYKKFPILGDIPLLGRLFQNHSKNITESELVVYVTPHLNHTIDEEGVIK